MAKKQPEKYQSFGNVLRSVFSLWFATLPKVFLLSLGLIGVTLLFRINFEFFNTFDLTKGLEDLRENCVFHLIYSVYILFCYIVLLNWFKKHINGEKTDLMSLLKLGGTRLFAGIEAVVIVSVVVVLGTMLFFVPGIYLSILLVFCVPLILIGDEMKPMQAFKYTQELVKNNWWRTAGVFFTIWVVFALGVSIIATFAEGVFVMMHPAGHEIQLLKNVLRIVWEALWVPLSCAAILLMMNDLKLRAAQIDQADA